jgi:hypothetical protein
VDFRTVAQRWMEETLFYRSAGYRAQIARSQQLSAASRRLDELSPRQDGRVCPRG